VDAAAGNVRTDSSTNKSTRGQRCPSEAPFPCRLNLPTCPSPSRSLPTPSFNTWSVAYHIRRAMDRGKDARGARQFFARVTVVRVNVAHPGSAGFQPAQAVKGERVGAGAHRGGTRGPAGSRRSQGGRRAKKRCAPGHKRVHLTGVRRVHPVRGDGEHTCLDRRRSRDRSPLLRTVMARRAVSSGALALSAARQAERQHLL